MNDKFMVIDATDFVCIGGFGNLEGNLGLLKYSEEEIIKMIKENNSDEDNIRLIISLLESIKQQNTIINKAIEELYIWGEILNPEFQQKILEILEKSD